MKKLSTTTTKKILPRVVMTIFLFVWRVVAIAADLTVSLDNSPPSGTLVFLLFDSANTLGDFRDPAKVVKRPARDGQVYRIENVPAGEYALLVYFDENRNDRLDKSFIGIPKEPLGFSNRYQPKGPPSYRRAAFVLAEGESRHFDVKLYRPLGERGRLGIGLGIIARSSPYRDYNGSVSQLIPAITYAGERLQIFGPNLRVGLVGSGRVRLAATGRYRIGVYEEDESDFLQGLGDREDTFMAGLAVQAELPGGVELSVSYEYDVLDNIGGSEARLRLDKAFQHGVFRISPAIGLNWQSSKLANHDFGVPESKSTSARSAYTLNDTITVEAGIRVFVEVTEDWLIIANAGMERLESEITDSPIVEKDYVLKGFAALNYVF